MQRFPDMGVLVSAVAVIGCHLGFAPEISEVLSEDVESMLG
jgi:hypothetical protein